MSQPRLKIADLDEETLDRIKDLESEMGTLILALSPQYPIAELTEEQAAKLKELEEELGVVLVAYQQ